jgi:hypothetical protein
MAIMKNANEKISVVKGDDGEIVSTKLQAVLKKPLDFRHLSVSVKYLMETI